MRICVIGGGPGGLSALYALTQTDDATHDVVLYEKQGDFGGMWIYNNATGVDSRGGVIPSAMYRDLYINNPKEVIEYPHFTYVDAFGAIAFPSFPPREVLLEYQLRMARHFDLYRFARFRHYVRDVRPVDEGDDEKGLRVLVVDEKDEEEKEEKVEIFDRVVVATGHFTTPNLVKIPGLHSFSGVCIHSCELRDLHMFRGKRVLTIGRGYSSESVVMEAYKTGASHITLSYRSKPNGNFGQLISEGVMDERGEVVSVEGEVVRFKDGSEGDYDVIVMCTGYLHDFPFMTEGLRLKVSCNMFYFHGLYKGVLLEKDTRVAYVGMQNLAYSNSMFLTQMLWLAKVYAGQVRIPERREEMEKDTQEMVDKTIGLDWEIPLMKFQTEYLKGLTEDGRLDVDVDVMKIMAEWQMDRKTDMMGHREKTYVSHFSGAPAIVPQVSWRDARHCVEFMGKAGVDLGLLDFYEKLGGVPIAPAVRQRAESLR